ncbi:fas-binding factor 1 homolog [Pterocles gutturalis]
MPAPVLSAALRGAKVERAGRSAAAGETRPGSPGSPAGGQGELSDAWVARAVPARGEEAAAEPEAPEEANWLSAALARRRARAEEGAPPDFKDPLADVLSNKEQDASKKPAPRGAESSPEKKPERSQEKEPPPSQPQLHTVASVWRKEELMSKDYGDEWLDVPEPGNGLKGDEKQGKKSEKKELRPARSKLAELLGRGSTSKILEQPGVGGLREFKQEKKDQKQPGKEVGWDKEDFVFGASQPRVASMCAGRPSRRQSVSRASAENSSELKLQPHSTPSPPVSRRSLQGSRAGGDWEIWKDEDWMDSKPLPSAFAGPATQPCHSQAAGPTIRLPAPEEAAAKREVQKEEGWLSALLSRDKVKAKAQEGNAKLLESPDKPDTQEKKEDWWSALLSQDKAKAKAQEGNAKPSESPDKPDAGEEGGLVECSPVPRQSQREKGGLVRGSPGARQSQSEGSGGNAKPSESPDKPDAHEKKEDWWSALLARDKAKAKAQEGNAKPSESPDKTVAQKKEDWWSALLSRDKAKAKAQEGNAKPSESPDKPDAQEKKEDWLRRSPVPRQSQSEGSGGKCQALGGPRRRAGAPLCCQAAELQDPSVPISWHGGDMVLGRSELCSAAFGVSEGCKGLAVSEQRVDVTTPRAHVQAAPHLQVRTLELERTQHKQLLESLQEQHQADLDLLESSHRQREEWLRQDKEQLVARLLSQNRDTEQAWAELLAQYQQRLATLEQQNVLELERLRELHRASIQEMRKNHEDELWLLKQLKDREMEAVTSTFSATRSLNGITEQVEKLFGDLRELSHKVEAVRHTTSEELATGARQQDKQLQMLQDRLSQHQRDMEEERSRHQEAMAKLEARLDEQARLLEQERRRAAAEQSKVESLQRSLEEQRRMMTQQLSVERAELERAKEQAELEAQEEQLRRERELLDKAWQELRLEKEKVNGAMLRIRQQEEEVKNMSELCSQKYEEGERALREACREVSEQQTSLQVMQQHLEQRKQQEQHLRQECLSMAHQRRQLQQLRQELRNNPTTLLTADQDLSSPTRGLSSTLFSLTVVAPHAWALVPGSPPPVRVLPWHSPVGRTETLATAGSAGLHATLVLLKHWAQQDHDFLEEQQFFLESLKKAPYNTSSRPG